MKKYVTVISNCIKIKTAFNSLQPGFFLGQCKPWGRVIFACSKQLLGDS